MKRKHGRTARTPRKRFRGAITAVGGRIVRSIHRKFKDYKNPARNLTKQFLKLRNADSVTRTLTRTTSQSEQGTSQHNDWNRLPTQTILKSNRKAIKTLGTFKLQHVMDYMTVNAYTGQQATNIGNGICTQSQLYGNTSAAITDWYLKWATSPWDLNPYSTPPQNAIYTASATITNASNDKLLLKSCHSTVNCVSLANIPQKVEVYYLLCNSSSSVDAMTAWSNVEAGLGYLQPLVAAPPANTSANGTPGFGGRNFPEQPLPKGFHKFWKVLSHDTFVLQPGDSMRLTKIMNYNRVITFNWMQNNAYTTYLKGLSIQTLFVVNGALVAVAPDTTFPATALDRVAQGRTKVGFLQHDNYVFGALTPNRYDVNRIETGEVKSTTLVTEAINDVDVMQRAATIP